MTTTRKYSSESARWKALAGRDPGAGDAFVYAVLTTGVYCRPGCRSRLPNRGNVRYFDNAAMATAAGFRPCKRCAPEKANPTENEERAIARACRMIEEADLEPSLRELADSAGWSSYHFQRLFRKRVGVTPKQYAMEVRARRLSRSLKPGSRASEPESRYRESGQVLGMKSASYRKGGAGVSIWFATAESYLGWVLIAATEYGICRIDIGAAPDLLERRAKEAYPAAEWAPADPAFTALIADTLKFLDAPERGGSLPMDIQGTAFQRRVWAALQEIPPGVTASYSEIARQIGRPKAARAVASACADNSIAIAIPCHRAVRADGGLGGYRWGLKQKQALLEAESKKTVR